MNFVNHIFSYIFSNYQAYFPSYIIINYAYYTKIAFSAKKIYLSISNKQLHIKYNILSFKIEIMWHTIGNVISLDIDFHIIYLIYLFKQCSTPLLDAANGLGEKILYIT